MFFSRGVREDWAAHARRATWSVADQTVGPALQLLVTPLLLKWLGAPEFGLCILALALASIGPMATLGAGTATIKHVSADLGAGRRSDAIAVVRAASWITSLGGGVLFLASLLCGRPVARIFFHRMGDPRAVGNALAVGMLVLVLQELDNVFAGALRGAQRFDVTARIELFGRFAWAGVTLSLAGIFGTAIAVLGGIACLTSLKLVVRALATSRVLNGRCWSASLDPVQARRLIGFGKWQWVQSVGVMLFSTIDRLLVGAWFGAPDLARYGICLQVAQATHLLPSAAMQVTFPWMSNRIARGQNVRGSHLVRMALIAGAFCLLLPLVLIPTSRLVLTLWLGATFARDNVQLLRVLVIAYGLLAFNVPAYFLLLGLGRVRFVSLTTLVAGTAVVAATVVLAPLGLTAFAAAKLGYGPVILLNYNALREAVND